MRRRVVKVVACVAIAAVVAGIAAGRYVYDRTGPRDAATAGQRVRSDTETLVSELGLQRVTSDISTDLGADGEECAVSDGAGRRLSEGPHRQHRIAVQASPPDGRVVTDLRAEAEGILRRLNYKIITSDVRFDEAPPPGIVIATWGWRAALEITVWPQPRDGTVRITGTSDCLPEKD